MYKILLLVFALIAAPVAAQTADPKSVAVFLQKGGYVIVFRHGATNRDQADTDPLNLENVAKQRQLSEQGRDVARAVGASFKSLPVPIGKVYTSRFHRAVETAQLLSGKEVTPSADLSEGGLVVTPIENDRRAEAFRKLVAVAPEHGTNTLIVSHKPNIIDAFGKDWFDVKEGEASIFRPEAGGKYVLVGKLQAAQWLELARPR